MESSGGGPGASSWQAHRQWLADRESVDRAGETGGRLSPDAAFRLCASAFSLGEFRQVQKLFSRTHGAGGTVAELLTMAVAAGACRLLGDTVGLREVAAAARSGRQPARQRGVAALHLVLATATGIEGNRQAARWHHASAVAAAEQANDPAMQAWLRIARWFVLPDRPNPEQALAEARDAVRLAEHAAVPFLLAHALHLRGRAQLCLGTVADASADLGAAADLFGQLGSWFVAWPLTGLGDLHRMRGHGVHARTAYEEALRSAESSGDVIGTGRALIGLARTRAPEDTHTATALVHRAIDLHEEQHAAAAQLTRGWIRLLAGDRQEATAAAGLAATAARRTGNQAALAESVALSVVGAPEPVARADQLAEAIALWRGTGCQVAEAAGRVLAARIGLTVAGMSPDQAVATLRNHGLDPEVGHVIGLPGVLGRAAPPVTIRALGAFRVIRDGTPVTRKLWQSRKARDLLKILVARRRPTPREYLIELLWPDADPGRSGKRLSVLLTMLRDILQPGPDQPQPLVTDDEAVWLDPEAVVIDVEDFLDAVAAALAADRAGHPDATVMVAAAAAAHTGDFLEDDPYQDWAGDIAEEIRAAHLAVLRALIRRRATEGDTDDVVRQSLRLLKEDPYDEQTHMTLVTALWSAHRFGEANRHYATYARRMAEMGFPAQAMPARQPDSRIALEPHANPAGTPAR